MYLLRLSPVFRRLVRVHIVISQWFRTHAPIPVFYFNSNELCRQVQRVNREQRQTELRAAIAVHSTEDLIHSKKIAIGK